MIVDFRTFFTLNKKNMASLVGAVKVGVTSVATLMTASDDLFADSFTHPFVEDKILSFKFIG